MPCIPTLVFDVAIGSCVRPEEASKDAKKCEGSGQVELKSIDGFTWERYILSRSQANAIWSEVLRKRKLWYTFVLMCLTWLQCVGLITKSVWICQHLQNFTDALARSWLDLKAFSKLIQYYPTQRIAGKFSFKGYIIYLEYKDHTNMF